MHFIRTTSSDSGREALTSELVSLLSNGKRVLWLVSGGSNIGISTQIAQDLSHHGSNLSNLKVMLIDERYGPVGHKDSNYQQLIEAGFNNSGVVCEPVLQEGFDIFETAVHYEHTLQAALDQSDVVVGQFGIGPDGHTAGILPHSEAASANMINLVSSYISDPYERVTMTFPAINLVEKAFIFAFGDDKLSALSQLLTLDLPLEQQPAQIFKQIPKAYLYNDQLGETE